MMALLPPSSRIVLPRRAPTVCATCLPMRMDPVAEIRGRRSSLVIHSPTSLSPVTRLKIPSGRSFSLSTSATMFCTATAHNGTFSEGFQIITSPQTAAIIAFQDHTATGKLNAVMMPTGPSGCHCSYMRCSGRSDCIVLPYNWRDWPTAKSQISIISCTSPRPSW